MPADQTVSLEISQNKLILKGGKSKFTLQTLPAEDFPLVQEPPTSARLQRAAKTLKDLLGQVSFAMAVHDIRYYLNGILFVAEGNAEPGGHRRPPPGLCQCHARRGSAQAGSHPAAQDRAGTAAPAQRRRRRHDRNAVCQQPGQVQLSARMEFVTKLVEGKFPRLQPRDPRNHRTA